MKKPHPFRSSTAHRDELLRLASEHADQSPAAIVSDYASAIAAEWGLTASDAVDLDCLLWGVFMFVTTPRP